MLNENSLSWAHIYSNLGTYCFWPRYGHFRRILKVG